VDSVLCSVQASTQESQSSPSRSLRVRLGVVTTVVIRISIVNISYSTHLLRLRW
jgi:hypothetical protein